MARGLPIPPSTLIVHPRFGGGEHLGRWRSAFTVCVPSHTKVSRCSLHHLLRTLPPHSHRNLHKLTLYSDYPLFLLPLSHHFRWRSSSLSSASGILGSANTTALPLGASPSLHVTPTGSTRTPLLSLTPSPSPQSSLSVVLYHFPPYPWPQRSSACAHCAQPQQPRHSTLCVRALPNLSQMSMCLKTTRR